MSVGGVWVSVGSPVAAPLPKLRRATGKHRAVCLCLFPFEPASSEPLCSAPHTLLHSSRPRKLGKTLTKLSYYSKGNLPRSTVISSSLVQFNSLVKAMINQLFTLPLLLH